MWVGRVREWILCGGVSGVRSDWEQCVDQVPIIGQGL